MPEQNGRVALNEKRNLKMNRNRNVWLTLATAIVLTGGPLTSCGFRLIHSDEARVLEVAALIPEEALMATFVITSDEQNWSQLDPFETEDPLTLLSANLQDFALMAPFFAVESQLWRQLNQLSVPETQVFIAEQLQEFEADLLPSGTLSYEADLEPLVTNMAVSILPPTEVRTTGKMNILLILGTEDEEKSREFIERVKGQPDLAIESIDYNDREILEIFATDRSSYVAVLDNYLIFSPERRSVELAIDAAQNDTSFKNQSGALAALRDTSDLNNPLVQIYVPSYADLLNQILVASASTPPLSQEALSEFEQVQSLAAVVNLEDNGLRFRVMVKAAPEAEGPQFSPVPGNAIEFFPADTVALLSGQNLQALWSAFTEQTPDQTSETSPAFPQPFDFGLDLDIEADVVSWMTGEFALGIIPVEQELMSQLGFSGVMVLETNDRAKTNSTLLKLDEHAQKTQLTIDKDSANGKAVTRWRLPQGLFLDPLQNETLLGYGWLNPDALFIALGSDLVDIMAEKSQGSLSNSPTFQAVVEALPAKNSGYFYLNLDALDAMTPENSLNVYMNQLPEGVLPTLGAIQSLGVTTTQRDRQTSQIEMFLVLHNFEQES